MFIARENIYSEFFFEFEFPHNEVYRVGSMEERNDLRPPVGSSTCVTIRKIFSTLYRKAKSVRILRLTSKVNNKFSPLPLVVSILFEQEFINNRITYVNMN